MGIQDRDYYREHYRNVVRVRPKPFLASSMGIAIIWVTVIAVLFMGFHFFLRKPPVAQTAPSRQPASSLPPAAPGSAVTAPRQAPPPTMVSPTIAPQVSSAVPIYRCGNAYSNTPCPGGRQVAAPAASGFDSRPSESLANLVARGRSPETNTTTTSTNTITTVENGVVRSNGSAAAQCPVLASSIEVIDRAARQPRAMPEQDRLRTERQRLRDRQAELHC